VLPNVPVPALVPPPNMGVLAGCVGAPPNKFVGWAVVVPLKDGWPNAPAVFRPC
jgi:hypothetical protein